MHARPWTAIYHAQTAPDLPPRPHPHLPALIREAAVRFRTREACALGLPNGVQGGLTFEQVDALSDAFAVYLRDVAGFTAGDRVAIQMPNCLAYPVVVFGALKAGVVMVNTNPLYTAPEMTKQFVDSGATGLVTIDLFADRVAEVLPATRIRRVVVVSLSDLLPTVKRWLVWGVQKYVRKMIPAVTFPHDAFTGAVAQGRQRIAAGVDPTSYARTLTHDSLAALQYTGGTTGVAKGAMLTHGNLLANIEQCLQVWRPWLLPAGDAILTALPLYHIFAFTANLMLFWVIGGRNVLSPSPRPLSNLRVLLERERFTWFTGVNTLFAALMHEDWFTARKEWGFTGSVAGGMALVPAVADRWEQVTRTPIYQGYGLTETSPVVTLLPFHRPKRGSIGIPVPGTDVRLVDDAGHDVPAGTPGEVVVRGPQVMQGYWEKPEETAQALRDGWFHTGDIAQMDDEGYFFIVDRKKDMILVSGFNVYPNEVEAAIASHPGVIDCAVVGVPDQDTGEWVVAYVVRKDASLTDEDIRTHCRETLTGYKVPKIVVFRDELPKSNVGKVLRKDLRSDAMSVKRA